MIIINLDIIIYYNMSKRSIIWVLNTNNYKPEKITVVIDGIKIDVLQETKYYKVYYLFSTFNFFFKIK